MMIFDKDLTDYERRRIWRAHLADMPFEEIVSWLAEQGFTVEPKPWPIDLVQERAARFRRLLERNRLPAGYPLGDDDLPFVAERDG